ncbi:MULTISPECIES: hypothetical protein [Actinomyces]|uniref:hypothetical protein n=1 Tax=Actinomyces TaxID=1654 RepID=UPI001E45E0DE|nr:MULTISPECIES: hypothetical protein [Actinomyces]
MSITAHALAAVWPRQALLAELDPAGSDLLYRARTSQGQPLDPEHGLMSLAAAVRRNPSTTALEHASVIDGDLSVLTGLARPDQASAIGAGWGALGSCLQRSGDVVADLGRLLPGSPSLAVAMAADALLLVVRPGIDSYGHLRERLRWIIEETSHRSERPGLGVLLIAPWKKRHEMGDLERLLASSGIQVPIIGTIADDPAAADAFSGRQARSVRRSLLVRSARDVAARLSAGGPR